MTRATPSESKLKMTQTGSHGLGIRSDMPFLKRHDARCWVQALLSGGLLLTLIACNDSLSTFDPYANGVSYPWSDAPSANSAPLALSGGNHFLSDLTWKTASSGWGAIERDRSNGEQSAGDGKTITVSAKTFAKGLGVHAPSSIVYGLNGQCSSFSAEVGLDDEVDANSKGKGSVTFKVWTDGTVKFDSRVMRPTDAAKSISLDLAGVKEIKLEVTNGGDDLSWDHADWGDAQVACTAVTTSPPAPPPPPQPPVTPPTSSVALTLSATRLERPALVTISANVTGPPPARLEFYRGATKIGEDSTAPYSVELALTKTETSSSAITAKAIDSSGKITASNAATLEVAISGRVLYVSPGGNDSNDGSSELKAVTIQGGANLSKPGDTILVMKGEYAQADANNNIVTMNHSGTSSAWIALMAYPGERPLLRSRNWQAISVQSSYILVEGFEIAGNRDQITLDDARSQQNNVSNPVTSGNCIGITEPYNRPGEFVHHVIVRNNIVHQCPGGGIYSVRADYMTIEDNVVWGNSYYSPYAASGISLYQNWNSDASTGIKNIIRRNVVYANQNLIPFYYSDPDPAKRNISDGNGIIIDDGRNTQSFAGSTKTPYNGRTLIENNVVYGNGGRGIHVFLSDHVDIFNNTLFQNSNSPSIKDGELTTIWASDTRSYNNIIVPLSNRPANQRLGTPSNPSDKTTQLFDFNLIFGGTGSDGTGTGSLIGVDPNFISASSNNFRLQPNSPAIDKGSPNFSALEDIDRVKRPLGAGVDLGAYETR